MTRSAALIALALLAGACSHRARAAPQTPVDRSTVITLERKPCYGFCPVYLLTVRATGEVTFDGRRGVDSMGTHTGHIDAARFGALVKLFDQQQFFALDDRYVMNAPVCAPYATDAPTVITSITTTERAKRVEHDIGCSGVPRRLGELERQIDSIVGTMRWISAPKK